MNSNTVVLRRSSPLTREEVRALLESLVQALVPQPGSIRVNYTQAERTTIYHIDCPKECIGHLIGAKGRTVSSLRTLLTAITAGHGFRSIIEIPFYEI
ncbi:KH domain-containing protein [Bdellovibrio sp. HCB117]|uniref:KH domain-containing protein n=1 Tax=Bdellovibrio TaxID=958 RepID=UPI000B29300A|nr:KH domain-containing protein [Bdellovibrio bacteriovorus]